MTKGQIEVLINQLNLILDDYKNRIYKIESNLDSLYTALEDKMIDELKYMEDEDD